WDIRILRRYGWNRLLLSRFPSVVFGRALRTFQPRGRHLPAGLRDDFWGSFRRPEVRRFITKLCAAYQGTLSQLPQMYRAITCPTLILWGGRDRHFPPVHAARLHRDIRGSRLEIIADGQHWMVWDLSAEVAAHIRTFQPT